MLNDVVYLASYRGPGKTFLHKLTHTLISKVTSSEFSHTELVLNGAGYSSSERDGGVRKKEGIDFKDTAEWDIIALPWLLPQDLLDFYEATKGDGYDFWGLRLFLGLADPLEDADKLWWCSEWCSAAMGLYDTRVSPGVLRAWAKLKERQYWINKDLEKRYGK